jgi:hypothetical protein
MLHHCHIRTVAGAWSQRPLIDQKPMIRWGNTEMLARHAVCHAGCRAAHGGSGLSRRRIEIHQRAGNLSRALRPWDGDVSVMGPVIEDFQRECPDVEVHYRLYESVPLYQGAINQSDEKPVAELLVSTAMGQPLTLVEMVRTGRGELTR